MKTILKYMVIGVFAMTGAAIAECDQGEIVIRFHHDAPDRTHPKGEAARFLAELVNGEMQGRACMEVTAEAPVLGSQISEDFAADQFEMGAPNIGALGTYSPRFLVFDLPFLFKDFDAVFAFAEDRTGLRLLEEATGNGVLGLAYWLDGMKAMSAKGPIRLPEDMQDLRIGTSDALLEQHYISTLGADAVRVPLRDLAQALSDGTVDGQNSTWTNISTRGLYENQASVTETNHGITLYMLAVDPAFWNGLPDDVRADLELFIAIASQERNRFAFELAELSKRNVRADGTPIQILDAEARLAWVRAMQPTWFEFGRQIGFDQIATALVIENELASGKRSGLR
jgi:C4-dicarboxylate-binding protein DctP